MIEAKRVKVGIEVRAKADFPSVPRGTRGRVTEVNGAHFLVTWDVPRQAGWAPATGLFSLENGLSFLMEA